MPKKDNLNFYEKIKDSISKYMLLENINIEATQSTNTSDFITRDLILSTANLSVGLRLFELSTNEIEKKILTIPWIESVRIYKRLPNTLYIEYTPHTIRALGIKNQNIWLITKHGRWIFTPNDHDILSRMDLPIITDESMTETELLWLEAIEENLSEFKVQVHEVSYQDKIQLILELATHRNTNKVFLFAERLPTSESMDRLKKVVQYLIKNNILVSTVDIRPPEKVVVNVGKRL